MWLEQCSVLASEGWLTTLLPCGPGRAPPSTLHRRPVPAWLLQRCGPQRQECVSWAVGYLNSGPHGHYSRFCCRYACTDNGHLLEIHYKRIVVQRVWRLLREVGIHTLALHDRFCVTGSEDGILRVWPLDFSAAYMEAGESMV